MKKNEFVEAIKATEYCADMTKKDIEAAINGIAEVITNVVAEEDSVKFANIGTFSGTTKAAKTARNPLTGAQIQVPEKHGYPVFKFSANMKKCD